MKKVNVSDFGSLSNKESAKLYVLTNNNEASISLCDYGATLVSVNVPDKNGNNVDVVLGYDDVTGYEKAETFFGATVGRNGNRIKNGSFTINGKTYQLEKNDNGNNLHSGTKFFNKRMWQVSEYDDSHVKFVLNSEDGDQGYPGKVEISVTYTLTEENEIVIEYEGVPSEDTILNMTNHSFFNLSGEGSGTVLEQEAYIDSDKYTLTDDFSIPTGELADVENTPMDFREYRVIGKSIDEDFKPLNQAGGYDHNWSIKGEGSFRRVAGLKSSETGIEMEVYTDLPGLQMYAGNYLERENGKNSNTYLKRHGICFETQFFPDAINHSEFISPITKAGQRYYTKTSYKFKTV